MSINVGNISIGKLSVGGGDITYASMGDVVVWGAESGGDGVDMELPEDTLGLLVDMTENQKLDLTTLLYTGKLDWGYIPTFTKNVEIDWGDGSEKTQTDCTTPDGLIHTYNKGKRYMLKLRGDIAWFLAAAPDYELGEGYPIPPAVGTSLAEHLTEIHVKGTCPIKGFVVLGSEVGWMKEYFAYCTKLTKIEGNIFSGLVEEAFNTQTSNTLFKGCDSYVQDVNSLLSDYFTRANELKVTKLFLNNWFAHTTNVVLSDDTFAKLPPTVTELNMTNMFSNSDVTSIPTNFFSPIPNTSTINMSNMFHDCDKITAAIPSVWNTHPNTVHTRCFMDCKNASNYKLIPGAWKS